jgi:hypothetical protein
MNSVHRLSLNRGIILCFPHKHKFFDMVSSWILLLNYMSKVCRWNLNGGIVSSLQHKHRFLNMVSGWIPIFTTSLSWKSPLLGDTFRWLGIAVNHCGILYGWSPLVLCGSIYVNLVFRKTPLLLALVIWEAISMSCESQAQCLSLSCWVSFYWCTSTYASFFGLLRAWFYWKPCFFNDVGFLFHDIQIWPLK